MTAGTWGNSIAEDRRGSAPSPTVQTLDLGSENKSHGLRASVLECKRKPLIIKPMPAKGRHSICLPACRVHRESGEWISGGMDVA